jgi:hypothetical protein
LHPQTKKGAIAQLVEQRTENPCVPGSIPGGTTPPFISPVLARGWVLLFLTNPHDYKLKEITTFLINKYLERTVINTIFAKV